jgi:hypothetical protein
MLHSRSLTRHGILLNDIWAILIQECRGAHVSVHHSEQGNIHAAGQNFKYSKILGRGTFQLQLQLQDLLSLASRKSDSICLGPWQGIWIRGCCLELSFRLAEEPAADSQKQHHCSLQRLGMEENLKDLGFALAFSINIEKQAAHCL